MKFTQLLLSFCRTSVIAAGSGLLALGPSAPAQAEIKYTITDLGTFGTSVEGYRQALGINATGQVVGYGSDYGTQAFSYANGTVQDLGSPYPFGTSTAYGVNASGQMAANAYGGPYAYYQQHAFLYSSGQWTDLGTLGGDYSNAFGINDSGQVVGGARNASDINRAFLYTGGTMHDIGTLGGAGAVAEAINNSGQIVGSASTSIGPAHAFLYSAGHMADLGTLPGGDNGPEYGSQAKAISGNGQIAGWSYVNGLHAHAFLYTGGHMTDLGTLGFDSSIANGVNNAGQVVGYLGAQQSAFLYTGGTLQDLNSLIDPTSGWHLFEADAINDAGQIVGDGYVPGYSYGTHAFLLTPVPEPSTFLLAALGMIGLVAWNKLAGRLLVLGQFGHSPTVSVENSYTNFANRPETGFPIDRNFRRQRRPADLRISALPRLFGACSLCRGAVARRLNVISRENTSPLTN